jgi:hypothetical protein
MPKNINDYKGLTEILLGPVRKRPGMYLGEAKISKFANFIIGYRIGYLVAKNDNELEDIYFGELGFIEWFYKKYNIDNTSH